jgi:nucleoid-associated protein YgaU
MSSERIVMGDAPDKKSKKGLIFILLGILLAIVVLVLLIKPFRKGTTEQQQVAQETMSKEVTSPPVTAPEVPTGQQTNAAENTVAAKTEENKSVEIVPTGQNKVHIVVKGECLWNIARIEYNDPFRWATILEANKEQIADKNLIYPDQKFIIPQ